MPPVLVVNTVAAYGHPTDSVVSVAFANFRVSSEESWCLEPKVIDTICHPDRSAAEWRACPERSRMGIRCLCQHSCHALRLCRQIQTHDTSSRQGRRAADFRTAYSPQDTQVGC